MIHGPDDGGTSEDPAQALEALLQDLRKKQEQHSDDPGARGLLDLLTTVAAATEMVKAVDRGDMAAAAFHSEVLLEYAESAQLPPLRIAEPEDE